jgi:hypothetical protein
MAPELQTLVTEENEVVSLVATSEEPRREIVRIPNRAKPGRQSDPGGGTQMMETEGTRDRKSTGLGMCVCRTCRTVQWE